MFAWLPNIQLPACPSRLTFLRLRQIAAVVLGVELPSLEPVPSAVVVPALEALAALVVTVAVALARRAGVGGRAAGAAAQARGPWKEMSFRLFLSKEKYRTK